MVRETADASTIPVSSPPTSIMSQPRPDRSSNDTLAQLRDEGVLPGLKQRDNAVAFHVPTENPNTPPRYHIRLKKLEKRMEERREKVKKPCPESTDDLKRQLSDAEVRRQELLGKKTDKISTTSVDKSTKVKAKKAARKMSSSFVITSNSDSDVITTRESHRTKQMERRLKERRRRVAKITSVDALETRQNLAAERRKDHVVATVSKAQKLARPHAISPAEEEPVSAGR